MGISVKLWKIAGKKLNNIMFLSAKQDEGGLHLKWVIVSEAIIIASGFSSCSQ